MKRMKYFILLILPLLFAQTACNGVGNGYSFKGTISGAANLQTVLEKAEFDRSIKELGRVSCDGEGNFAFDLKEAYEPGLYVLTVGAKKMYFILDGKEKQISVKGELNTIDRLQVTFEGSETAACYTKFVQGLYNSKFGTSDQVKEYINANTCNPLMTAFFTIQLLGQDPITYFEDFKAAEKGLNDYLPQSKYATDFSNMIKGVETQVAAQKASGAIVVGADAPEISLPGPDGKTHSLSELRGKVVLLDFWASWCGPCRRANPHVVEMYNKYNSKGFEVFSVSLDNPNGKDKWIKAIQDDGLIWPNHVSDLKGWDCAPAGVYGVRAIPRTFLIGRDGKIIAIDPRDNLESELQKVL